MEYGLEEVRASFHLWSDGGMDEDLDRRADLVRAFRLLPKLTKAALTLWAQGYTNGEIARAVYGPGHGPKRGSRLLAQSFDDLRRDMNVCRN